MEKDTTIKILGLLFLLFGIAAIVNTSIQNGPENILWFCYFGLCLIGIGALTKNSSLVKSQLNILTIPLIIWTVDFFSYFFLGHTLFNITSYFFEPFSLISKTIALQHLFTIPLGILLLKKINKKAKLSWMISLIQIIILFLLSRIFTNYEQNLNWAYHTSLDLSIPFYPLFWFASMILVIILTDKTLKKLFQV
ncbi:hypothetical protein J4474_02695 [Candidatus Pacearchaeota archaeon]|nr:hypothetical protein [Candidatus Pacearchaeota archaeon]